MNKKKISIVAVSAVVIVALGLGFNSIFKKANTSETAKNDTVVAEQLAEKNDELNTEETKVDDVQTEKDNKENKDSKENKENKEDKNKKDTTEASKDSDVKDSESTKTSKEEAKKQDKSETTKTNDDEVKKTENSEKPKQENTAKPKPVKTEKPKPVNTEKPKPGNTEKPKPGNNENTKPNTKTVKIAISCKTAINSGVNKKPGFTHLPSSGMILQNMEVEFKDGDTVFDILLRATRKKGIHMEYSGGGSNVYIEGINNLYEFDGGPQSGWMYSVNGVYPNYGVSGYKVKSSDVIRFNYTCNLGADLGVKAN